MTPLLIFAVFAVSLFTMGAYTIVAPWWRYRSGRAYFVLFTALCLVSGWFLVEALIGEGPDWMEDAFIAAVLAAILWNSYTIIGKQIAGWKREHPKPSPLIVPTDGTPDA